MDEHYARMCHDLAAVEIWLTRRYGVPAGVTARCTGADKIDHLTGWVDVRDLETRRRAQDDATAAMRALGWDVRSSGVWDAERFAGGRSGRLAAHYRMRAVQRVEAALREAGVVLAPARGPDR